jgi:general secretion pathway protein D
MSLKVRGFFRAICALPVRVICAAAAGFSLLSLGGCSLSHEQLALPTPIGGGIQTGSITKPGGTALGDQATAGADAKAVYEGSGQFTKPANATSRQTQGKAFGAVNGDGVTLDLVNASIPEASKAVLGDVLGVPFVVSDQVKGSVTLQTTNPVSKDGLVEIFEAVLATNGAALAVDAGVYKVVTREQALTAGLPVASRQSGVQQPGLATEIVPLKYVSATEIERVLSSVAPKNGIARVDSARNLIVLTGTRAEIASMVETVRVFDVDWMRGMSFGIFPIETNDVEAIAQELDTIFANDRESPTKGVVRFVPNARMKSIVVISSRPEYLKKADTWIKRIDLASAATEKRAFVYRVRYRPVQELAQLLQKVYASRDVTTAAAPLQQSTAVTAQSTPTAADFPPVATVAQRSRAPGGIAAPPVGPLPFDPAASGPQIAPQQPGFAGQPGDAASAAGTLTAPATENPDAALPTGAVPSGTLARLPPDDRNTGISVVADDTNNSLVITATPSEMKRIRQILAELDILPEQVLIEATIAEVTLTDDLKFGLRWFFERGGNEFRLTDTLANGTIGAIAPQFAGFSYFLNLSDAKVALNALSDLTNVNVVSSPSLMVLNNKKATLQIGDEVPVATQAAVSVITPDAPIVNAITFRETGVLLNIIPRISDDGRILLDIEQEVSDVKSTTSSTINSPTIQQRRIKTTVSVDDGGSIVLAGLMQDRATRTRQQVPLAGDIPLVGNLFKNKDDQIQRTELLIAITPHVVKDNAQMDMIASEFRDRLNFQTRPQRSAPPDHKETLDRILR